MAPKPILVCLEMGVYRDPMCLKRNIRLEKSQTSWRRPKYAIMDTAEAWPNYVATNMFLDWGGETWLGTGWSGPAYAGCAIKVNTLGFNDADRPHYSPVCFCGPTSAA